MNEVRDYAKARCVNIKWLEFIDFRQLKARAVDAAKGCVENRVSCGHTVQRWVILFAPMGLSQVADRSKEGICHKSATNLPQEVEWWLYCEFASIDSKRYGGVAQVVRAWDS